MLWHVTILKKLNTQILTAGVSESLRKIPLLGKIKTVKAYAAKKGVKFSSLMLLSSKRDIFFKKNNIFFCILILNKVYSHIILI